MLPGLSNTSKVEAFVKRPFPRTQQMKLPAWDTPIPNAERQAGKLWVQLLRVLVWLDKGIETRSSDNDYETPITIPKSRHQDFY